MPADPIHPDQFGGAARFRVDLLAYLDSCPSTSWGSWWPIGVPPAPRPCRAAPPGLAERHVDRQRQAEQPGRGSPRHPGALGEPSGSPSLARHRARLLGQ
jgi:hypothetical protein